MYLEVLFVEPVCYERDTLPYFNLSIVYVDQISFTSENLLFQSYLHDWTVKELHNFGQLDGNFETLIPTLTFYGFHVSTLLI